MTSHPTNDPAILESPVILESIDLLVDGGLSMSQAQRLRDQIAAQPALRHEMCFLERLRDALAADRVEVSGELADSVMARLQTSTARSRVWPVAIAAVAVLALVAAAVLRPLAAAASGPLSTVAAFLASSAVAGSGLLAASWRGVGGWVSSWLGESAPNLLLGLLLVVSANLLLVVLLRRRRSSAAAPARRSRR